MRRFAMMTRVFTAALVAGATMAAAGSPALACGDKFLVPTRSTRFERAPGPRTAAAILIYANPGAVLPQALPNTNLARTPSKAGYRPTIARDEPTFNRALAQGKWDVVLVGAADVTPLQGRLLDGDPPVILPVLRDPSHAELAEAKAMGR